MLGDTDSKGEISTIYALLGAPMATERFLRIAINCASALAHYHDQGLIHKKLCPHCFHFNPADDSVTFIVDEVAIIPSHNQHTLLAYMSPEQTGCMNRPLDYRSDLYSLGIILYQIATGVLPFVANDVLEWVHCHIARTPEPPVKLLPSFPLMLSDILMKLLAKPAEERYQTASGLKLDLENCLAQFVAKGFIGSFQLCAGDISRQLLIPQKLYGREKENEALAFERAALFYQQRGFEKEIGNLDLFSAIKASQAISGEIVLKRLLETLMRITMENAGAQKGCLLLYHGGEASIAIEAVVDGAEIKMLPLIAKLQAGYLPQTLFNYVSRTREALIVDDATTDELLLSDPYVIHHQPLSTLCLPLLRQSTLIGLLYLENHLLRGAFTADRVAFLELLAAQAAISLENAQMYEEQSRTESVLRKSEEKYREIFEHCGTALAFIEEDSTLSMCNREFEVLSGYSHVEVEGVLKWSDTVAYPDELKQMSEYHRLRRIDSEMAPHVYEFHFKDKFGVVKDVVATVSTIPGTKQSMAALMDISEHKRNEADRVRLVTAIEQSADAIFITDRNWHIIYANRSCQQITGYDNSELIGKHTHIFKSGRHDKIFYQTLKKTLDRGEPWTGLMSLKKKDGALYEAEATNAPVLDESGTTINYVCTHRDVTKELKLERDLRQSQKMEAIGTLAGGIAHDFNNILTAVIGYADLALRKVGDEAPASRDLHRVLEASLRAKDLITQILTFSRQKDQEREQVHVAAIVAEVCKLLRSSIPSTIEIHQNIKTAPNADMVLADSTQIHQILMNLSTNAAHAMKDTGGLLSITLSEIEVDAVLLATVPDILPGSFVRISVGDTGHGMDAVVRERIFDPYFTTKKVGEGTGMGLAMVQGIVKSHGGSISVYSEPGLGTTFHIFLPKIEVDEVACFSDSAENNNVHGGSERILFVDDEPILAEMGEELFGSLGYRVTTTTSSSEALKIFIEAPHSFDLVITDMTMPGLTGKELAEKIIAIRPDMPIILCTGFSDAINEKQAHELGVKAFVMKPYSIRDLDGVVREVLDSQ